jgi:hypothetical protein
MVEPVREQAGPEHEIRRTTSEARQGETSGHVRMILAAGIALAIVAGLIVYGITP